MAILTLITLWTGVPSLGATLMVTSLADDSSVGTLRYAIANANSGDTITFGVEGTITLTHGVLELAKDSTVSGPGRSKQGGDFRIDFSGI